jgi:hypothetical protein
MMRAATSVGAAPRRSRWSGVLLLVPLAAGALAAARVLPRGVPGPVAIRTDAPLFATVGGLLSASDVVVVGVVRAVHAGRIVAGATASSASDSPGAVLTQLADLEVTEVLRGEPTQIVVLEQPAQLPDGRAVVVDGIDAVGVGERVLLFGISGRTDEFPYVAVVNGQGLYRLTRDDRIADAGAQRRPGWSLAELRQAAAGCRRAGPCL